MKKWLAIIVPALCSAKCTHKTYRNLEVVYVYDGYDPDHSDAFQDVSNWISDISGESYGAQLKFTAVMSGGMKSTKCFQHVTGPTNDIAAAVADMKATPWLGDDGESDYDSRNVLNTLVYATSLFNDKNVWPEWDRILVYVSGNYVPDWGTKVTQPLLTKGQMKCSGALEPPTRDQLVKALEAKRIKMVLSIYGPSEAKKVRYWFKPELFAYLKDASMFAFHQPQATASDVVAKTRALVYQLYCLKNLQLTGFVDTYSQATRDATGYSGAISNKLSCLNNSAKRTHKSVALAYRRKTCELTKPRSEESTMRAHDWGIREAASNYKDGSVALEDQNSVTAIPHLLKEHLCTGDAGNLCVLTFIAEQPPEFSSSTTDFDYTKFACGRATGSQYQMVGRQMEYMQELVVIVPPDLPDADEIYQQWKIAANGAASSRIFVIDPKLSIEDETNRVAASLGNLLGWTVDDAQQTIDDPQADVELQVVVDNSDQDGFGMGSVWSQALFGATGSFCEHWVHGHNLSGAMVEVGTEKGLCLSDGDNKLRPMDELGLWSTVRKFPQTKYDVISCVVMRELLRRTLIFSSPGEKPIRKILLLVTHSIPKSQDEIIDFLEPEVPGCDTRVRCPSREQLRAALEMTNVNLRSVVRNKNDGTLWNQFWETVGIGYYSSNFYFSIEANYWNSLRQLEGTAYFAGTFSCFQPPESPIRIFMIADSSHTQLTQDATALAAMFTPYRLEQMLEPYTSDIEIILYSSSLLDSPQCFKEIGPVTPDIDVEVIDSLPFVDEAVSEDLSFAAGALHITSQIADSKNINLIVYATDKVFNSGTAKSNPNPLTCPLDAPEDAALEDAAVKSGTGLIVGVNIGPTIVGLEETWKYKTRTMPNTGNVININYSQRSWAYNSMMAIATSVCGGVYDPGDTVKPPGLIDAVKNLAAIVAGFGAAVGLVMGGLALWKVYQPPKQISFTMEGSGELDTTGNEAQGVVAEEQAFT